MSLSRSPIWTHRAGAPSKAMDWRRFSSQRMLSLASMGTRVGLTLRLSAAVPLNCRRDQNFTPAARFWDWTRFEVELLVASGFVNDDFAHAFLVVRPTVPSNSTSSATI